MRGTKFPEATRALQAPKGMNEDQCVPLYVWQGVLETHYDSGERVDAPVVASRWEPSAEERAAIAAGAPVWLWIYGRSMPPVRLETHAPFEPVSPPPPTIG